MCLGFVLACLIGPSSMAYSIFPLFKYLVWLAVWCGALPLDPKIAPAFNSQGNRRFNATNKTWEKTPSAEVLGTVTWFAALSLGALVVIMYARVLSSLARQWWNDPNYGHGFFVPVLAGYALWRVRDRWRAVPARPSNFGVAVMLFAVGLRILGMLGAEMFMARLSLVILISGIVLFLSGREVLRSVAFPIGYLLFMIPLPAIVYYQLTLPLQLWASRLGAAGLVALGIHTVRQGNLLFLPNCTLNVVEACSGIRSLLSLLAAAVAYGYLAEQSTWKRSVLAIASIPIAIATNGLRLVATGVLSYFFGPGEDSGVAHVALGLGFFALAVVSILLIHKILGLHLRQKNSVVVSP
jgi:exosortase